MKLRGYAQLTEEERQQVAKNLELRRRLYERNVLRRGPHGANALHPPPAPNAKRRVALIGDRPGPGAPRDPSYHHTPFYSTKNSSGWLNALLVQEEIPEDKLIWLNAYDKDGIPADPRRLLDLQPAAVVALGGNAASWLRTIVRLPPGSWIETYHPQYWKRFRAKERYPLLDILRELTR